MLETLTICINVPFKLQNENIYYIYYLCILSTNYIKYVCLCALLMRKMIQLRCNLKKKITKQKRKLSSKMICFLFKYNKPKEKLIELDILTFCIALIYVC